jgi:hypothetical protein
MKVTKAVQAFLDRTGTGFKHYTFNYTDNEGVDGFATFSCREAASEYTKNGGKLAKLDENQLGYRFALMRGWHMIQFSISDGV